VDRVRVSDICLVYVCGRVYVYSGTICSVVAYPEAELKQEVYTFFFFTFLCFIGIFWIIVMEIHFIFYGDVCTYLRYVCTMYVHSVCTLGSEGEDRRLVWMPYYIRGWYWIREMQREGTMGDGTGWLFPSFLPHFHPSHVFIYCTGWDYLIACLPFLFSDLQPDRVGTLGRR
jgi:hypothetical protein